MSRSTGAVALLVVLAVLSTRWVRLNISLSAPYGLYRLAPISMPIAHGTLIVLPVPVSVQAWWSSWVPLLKPVAAIAGETVCVAAGVLWVRGVSYGAVLAASHGLPLPHIEGCLVVPPGSVFFASQVTHSLDGRYFGCVPLATVLAQAVPLITW